MRYVPSIGKRTMVRGGTGWGREVTVAQESAGVWKWQQRPLPFYGRVGCACRWRPRRGVRCKDGRPVWRGLRPQPWWRRGPALVAAEASSSATVASGPLAIFASARRRRVCSSFASFNARQSPVFSASRRPALTVLKGIWTSLIWTAGGISAQKGAMCCMWGRGTGRKQWGRWGAVPESAWVPVLMLP